MSGEVPSGVPSQYDQFTKPTDPMGKSQGYAWWQGMSPVTNLVGGDRYVNEGDPSWEDVITMVVIPGEPSRIRNAAGIWEALFSRIEQAKTLLDDGIGDLKSWKGDAGTAYRNHLMDVSKSLGELIDKHRTVVVSLRTAAQNLETAIAAIPIPDDMAYEVQSAKQGFDASGKVAGLGPDGIYNALLPVYGNKWVDELREAFSWDWAQKNLRDWISGQDDIAKNAYKKLAGEHVGTMDGIPEGSQLNFHEPTATEYPTATQPSSPKVPGSVPGTGSSPDLSNKGYDPSTSMPGYTDPDGSTPGTGISNPGAGGGFPGTGGAGVPGSGSSPDLGSGLAGAGGGGLSGAGGGGGGGLPGAGAGGGGLGAGGGGVPGAGSGLGGVGSGLPGVGAGAGGLAGGLRGGAGAGAGAGAGRAGAGGMMGGGPGGGGHGDGDEHSTWLNEDDDVWGSDTDVAPPVLGS